MNRLPLTMILLGMMVFLGPAHSQAEPCTPDQLNNMRRAGFSEVEIQKLCGSPGGELSFTGIWEYGQRATSGDRLEEGVLDLLGSMNTYWEIVQKENQFIVYQLSVDEASFDGTHRFYKRIPLARKVDRKGENTILFTIEDNSLTRQYELTVIADGEITGNSKMVERSAYCRLNACMTKEHQVVLLKQAWDCSTNNKSTKSLVCNS